MNHTALRKRQGTLASKRPRSRKPRRRRMSGTLPSKRPHRQYPAGVLARLARSSWKRVVLFAGVVALAGIIAILIAARLYSTDLPSLEQLETYNPRLVTRVLGRDGAVIKEFYTEKRVQVPLDSLSPHLIDAVLATEDQRFYKHWGVDPFGVARAAMVNIASLSTEQGASTLTQQLARNLYLHMRQTLKRKIREAITAVQIERTYTKDEILSMYFTQMYFGHGAYGAESAARLYFGKSAKELTLPEAALLVGLLKAPNNYTPLRYPEKAKRRRNIVLALMRDAGYISELECRRAARSEIVLARDTGDDLGEAPYFSEWVRQDLERLEDKYGFDYYRDGLTVHTTLDPELQRLAEAAVDSHITGWQAEFERTRARGNVFDHFVAGFSDSLLARGFRGDYLLRHPDGDSAALADALRDSAKVIARAAMRDSALVDSVIEDRFQVQVAFIAIDPLTGDVLAMIGGRDFRTSKFNRAVQAARQPGSVFKPFVYTTAVDNGIYGNHRVMNMVQPVLLDDGTWWRPENYDITNRGEYVTLRKALRRSLNNVTVRLVAGEERVVPIRAVIQTAHRMGISTPLRAVPALALGASDVIPLDVTTAYSVLSAGGVRTEPRSITRIEDRNGQQIISIPIERAVVLSEETAAIMTDMLSDVINRGTGGSVRWKFKFYAPAAGKTGTTNNFNNAWFAGFTPRITAVVWLGFDDPQVSLGPGQAGSRAALPIWAMFMKWAYEQKGWEHSEFELPVGVVEVQVDEDTGLRAGPLSSHVYTELFRRGDEPPAAGAVSR
ncbi:MAG: Penicillin-binding protein 1A [Calditrichaeota bacterium]|nr:Penicillin-binding protein 1A [Calditrichota bacterium]